jgi:hypothetical protein
MRGSAIISICGMYRYRLERVLGDGPTMMFLMVNPSLADADHDDPTVRKCIGFAERNHYGRVLIGNEFAHISPDVRTLPRVRDPIGPDNDAHVRGMIAEANVVIAAWGTLAKLPEALRPRWKDMVRLADAAGITLHCLGVNEDKHPRHPLMLAYDTPISRWSVPWMPGRKERQMETAP